MNLFPLRRNSFAANYRFHLFTALAATLLCAATGVTQAATIQVDFNNLTTGQLSGQNSGAGLQPWAGHSSLSVIGGDLDPSTYNTQYPGQSPPPQRVQGNLNSAGQTAASADLVTPMLEDDIWFSFLLNQPNSTSRGGVDLNGARFVAVGGSLVVVAGGTNPTAPGISLLNDNLIVGQLQISDAGNDTIRLWINPADINNLGTEDLLKNDANPFGVGGITSLGVESYNNGSTEGGIVDHIILASSQAEFLAAVFPPAPVPEPGTLVLSLFGAALVGFYGRRMRKSA